MMPMGVPMKVATSTIRKEPYIALAMPPGSLGAGVMAVSVSTLRPPMPSRTVSIRIQSSQNTPKAMAAIDRLSISLLTSLRRLNLAARESRVFAAGLLMMCGPRFCAGA